MAAPITRRDWLALAGNALLAPLALADGAAPLGRMRRRLFGSPVELLSAAPAALALQTVVAGLQRIDARWNAWKPGELSRLNDQLRAGRTATPTPELAAMIRSATVLERLSGGLFNPAIGGLVGAWGFHDDELRPGRRPTAATLAPWTEAAPSLAQLEWRGPLLRCHHPRLQLDFGAYAKGVAADWALDRLLALGINDAVVNLGGNLAAMGQAPGRPWRVGVRDPDSDAASPRWMATLDTRGREAVVTSGTYERWRELDGERATHILDPRSGQPAQALVSVTVVHQSAALADAAATALLVAGPQRWAAVAERLGVDQVLVIDAQRRALASDRLLARLQPASADWQWRLRRA